MSPERDSAKAADDRNVKSGVVPPSDVVSFIYSDVVFEYANNERDGSNPAVPYAPEESCGSIRVVDAVAWHTAC